MLSNKDKRGEQMFRWGHWLKQPAIYVLIGYPLSKTFSPRLHNTVFQELHLQAVYLPLKTPCTHLATVMESMRALNWRGANVTIPYKETIMPYLDEIDPLAQQIGAINTIVSNEGRLIGYNTDSFGFVRSLPKPPEQFSSALCVGAGGAARAVCFGLLQHGLTELTIVNRTESRAQLLKQQLRAVYPEARVTVKHWDVFLQTGQPSADLIVNTIPVDLPFSNDQYYTLFAQCKCAYDLRYQLEVNPFIQAAAQCGVSDCLDGLAMLIWQAAEAFRLWTGLLPIDIMQQVMS